MTQRKLPRAAIAAITAAVATIVGCAADSPLPAPLAPPVGEQLSHVLNADGVQIYECTATKGGGHAWMLKAPEARLVDAATRRDMGRHYGGPTWEAADGSRIVGQLKARTDAPDPSAIPWLLIEARSTGGDGAFAAVRSIQRVHTEGGKAPAGACDAGSTVRVPYRAVYRFYRSAAAQQPRYGQADDVPTGPLAIAPEHVGLFPDEFHPTVAAMAAS